MLSLWGQKCVTKRALYPNKMQSIPPLTSHNKLESKNNIIILQQEAAVVAAPICENCDQQILLNQALPLKVKARSHL